MRCVPTGGDDGALVLSRMPQPKERTVSNRLVLRNNLTVHINGEFCIVVELTEDYVYISAPWAAGLGEPYIVARVMDFVTTSEGRGAAQKVKVNIFYRMRDLTHRLNNDPRLLVATMHTDYFPAANVRGKCRVRHRDLIGNGSPPDLAAWKRRDDHFYYHQLFDRYIHRFYDVVPTYKLKNAPKEVLATLRERYSFIVAEVSVSSDLCDALRGCAVCRQWASSTSSVRCDTCRKFFHMHCLSPPLVSKPAKGYSWTCAPCTKNHDDIVEEQSVGGGRTDNDAAAAPRGPRQAAEGSRKASKAHLFGDVIESVSDKVLPTAKDRDGLRSYQGWPYRYFGEHTNAMDVLDAHDIIYPRAVTRLGPKYQAQVPAWNSTLQSSSAANLTQDTAETTSSNSAEKPVSRSKRRGPVSKKKRTDTSQPDPSTAEEDMEDMERGTSASIDVISTAPPDGDWAHGTPVKLTKVDYYLTQLSAPRTRVPPHAGVFINRALALLNAANFDFEQASRQMAQTRDSDLGYAPLPAKDVQVLEKTITEQSGDLSHLKRALPHRTPVELVHAVYEWKLRRLAERWQGREKHKITLRGPRVAASGQQQNIPLSCSVMSLTDLKDMQEQKQRPKLVCGFCGIAQTPFWYKGPLSSSRVLCIYCGQYWRKYAAETASAFITEGKRAAAQENGSEEAGFGLLVPQDNGQFVTQKASIPRDIPTSAGAESSRCVMCRRVDPKRTLVLCAECGMRVHQGCVGEELEDSGQKWLCDVCHNSEDPAFSLLPCCVLCGESPSDKAGTRTRKAPLPASETQPLTALDVYKPTECNNWVHLLCSVWIPEVLYGDSVTLRPAEGCGSLPVSRYEAKCSICGEIKGACVACAEPTCRIQFHVSCAFLAQPSCAFAFEIFPVKTSRKQSVNTLTFKSESGHMCAQIWCKEHLSIARSKKTYDLYEIDPKTKLTALQAYVRTHKQVPRTSHRNMALVEATHALLRRAKKLDSVIQSCGGAGGYVRDGALVPMTGPKDEDTMEIDSSPSITSTTQGAPATCVQCHSTWSPIWWPVPNQKAQCCNLCRASVLGHDTTFL